MRTDLIIVSDYCQKCHIEPSFIISLEEGGLIEVVVMENEKYLQIDQLRDLEKYARMYYDLSINIEGIDVIRHLLSRMETMQQEISFLKNRVGL